MRLNADMAVKILALILVLTASVAAEGRGLTVIDTSWFGSAPLGDLGSTIWHFIKIDTTFPRFWTVDTLPRSIRSDTAHYYAKVDTVLSCPECWELLEWCLMDDTASHVPLPEVCVRDRWSYVVIPDTILDTTWLPKIQVWLDSTRYDKLMEWLDE